MQKSIIKNIKQLILTGEANQAVSAGLQMQKIGYIENAWIAMEDGIIADFGSMNDWPGISDWKNLDVTDAEGGILMPAFCDSHTHLVYAASREKEFVDRIKGLSYQEIAERGGGILNSAVKMAECSEEKLFEDSYKRAVELIQMGTGAIEIKSGYGLTLQSELKMLRVIRRLKEVLPIPVKATFLGAHAIPLAYKNDKEGYINYILKEMLPAIASEKLADFCDVFCENGYFSKEETIRILDNAGEFGLTPKVHAEQLSHSGGVEAGVHCKAISVDHLEYVNENDIHILKQSNVMPVILPGAAYFLNLPYPPARKMIDSGLPLAIATDFNPGSSPCGNMQTMLNIACVQYKLLPEEVLLASTLNAAFAMSVEKESGSIAIGKRANFILTKPLEHYHAIPYYFGNPWIQSVFINGKIFT